MGMSNGKTKSVQVVKQSLIDHQQEPHSHLACLLDYRQPKPGVASVPFWVIVIVMAALWGFQ